MKKIFLAALFTLSLGGIASAETFEFPSSYPVASVTFPDNWKAEETDDGVQGFSEGDEVAFYLSLSKPASMDENVQEAIAFLVENGVEVDQDSMEQSQGDLNGIPAKFTNFDGKDENGKVTIGLYFLEVTPKATVIVTNWSSLDENGNLDDAIGQEMGSIINSIKAVD